MKTVIELLYEIKGPNGKQLFQTIMDRAGSSNVDTVYPDDAAY